MGRRVISEDRRTLDGQGPEAFEPKNSMKVPWEKKSAINVYFAALHKIAKGSMKN